MNVYRQFIPNVQCSIKIGFEKFTVTMHTIKWNRGIIIDNEGNIVHMGVSKS